MEKILKVIETNIYRTENKCGAVSSLTMYFRIREINMSGYGDQLGPWGNRLKPKIH